MLDRRALLITATAVAAAGLASAADAPARSQVVLVAGATGRTGQHVVTQLKAAGHKVRGLSRNAEAAKKEVPDVEWFTGDLRDAATLREAVKGAETVIWAAGSSGARDPSNSPEEVDYKGAVNLIDAFKAAGGKHFVLITSIGVTDPNHRLNKIANNVMTWKLRSEEHLRKSGLSYTIVRPGGLWDEPGNQLGILLAQGDKIDEVMIARPDVAEVTVEAATNPAFRNKTFEIFNVAARDKDGWKKLAATLPADK